LAFKIAGSMAFQDAARKAKPVLLEPVMRVEVTAPNECVADVMANLSTRRAEMPSQDDGGGVPRISARVPLSEMFGYAADLRAMTQGRGAFAMEFAGYQPRTPGENQDADGDSIVGAPRKPTPTLRESRVAMPEPPEEERPD
jgi:elongation factor G